MNTQEGSKLTPEVDRLAAFDAIYHYQSENNITISKHKHVAAIILQQTAALKADLETALLELSEMTGLWKEGRARVEELEKINMNLSGEAHQEIQERAKLEYRIAELEKGNVEMLFLLKKEFLRCLRGFGLDFQIDKLWRDYCQQHNLNPPKEKEQS